MELGRCKKHTSHKYSKGVCPFCLREKLVQFTASSASSTAHSSSSYVSESSSAGDSPKRTVRHRRTKTLLQLLGGGNTEGLVRSRSMAFPVGEQDLEETEQKKSKKKTGRRFWSKLMKGGGGRSKKGDQEAVVLHHSKTTKEKSSSKWDLFSH